VNDASQATLARSEAEAAQLRAQVEALEGKCAALEGERDGALQARDAAVAEGASAQRLQEQQQRGLLAVAQESLARSEAQVAALRGEVDALEGKCSRLDVERESALRQVEDAGQEARAAASALQAARQRAGELERAAQEAAASRRQVEADAREAVERCEAGREQALALAEAQREALEQQVRHLTARVAELKEDKDTLQATLTEAIGRVGDASLSSEAHWKERLGDAEVGARRKLEQLAQAHEQAMAAVTRGFESERDALCLRVTSLEAQVADAAAEAEVRQKSPQTRQKSSVHEPYSRTSAAGAALRADRHVKRLRGGESLSTVAKCRR